MAMYIMEEAAVYNVDEETEPPSVVDHRPGFTWIGNDVLYTRFDGLSDKARLAYIYLCSLSNGQHTKFVWPGKKWMAERLSCTEKTARAAIAELERAGLVRVESSFGKDGRQQSNHYHIMNTMGEGEAHYPPGGKPITPKQDVSNNMVVKPDEQPLTDDPAGVQEQPLLPEPVFHQVRAGVKRTSPKEHPVKEEVTKKIPSPGVQLVNKDTHNDYAIKGKKEQPLHAQIVTAYLNALEGLGRVVDRSAFPRYVKTAKVLADIGYTPEHVHEKTVEMGSQAFWKDKGLPIERVADSLMVLPPQPLKVEHDDWSATLIDDDPFSAMRNKLAKGGVLC